jgi:hypothetical protein
MSAYSVAQNQSGDWTWWLNWEMASSYTGAYKNIRPATAEESALMDKIVWETDTPEDRKRLRELLSDIKQGDGK